MAEYIQRLSSVTSEETFVLRVRRTHVLVDTLQEMNKSEFSPYKTLFVSFTTIMHSYYNAGNFYYSCQYIMANKISYIIYRASVIDIIAIMSMNF